MHFMHELAHALTAVVAGDVIVQVFPNALDAVVIGTEGRQKMQTHATAHRRQRQPRALTVVDLEVVQHHVNARGARIFLEQFP